MYLGELNSSDQQLSWYWKEGWNLGDRSEKQFEWNEISIKCNIEKTLK